VVALKQAFLDDDVITGFEFDILIHLSIINDLFCPNWNRHLGPGFLSADLGVVLAGKLGKSPRLKDGFQFCHSISVFNRFRLVDGTKHIHTFIHQ